MRPRHVTDDFFLRDELSDFFDKVLFFGELSVCRSSGIQEGSDRFIVVPRTE